MKLRKPRKKDILKEQNQTEQAAQTEQSVIAEQADEGQTAETDLQVEQTPPVSFDWENDEQLKREFVEFKVRALLHRIDHTLLKQDCTQKDIMRLCDEANEHGFYSVCVQPVAVSAAKKRLGKGSRVKVATVIGFPMGENLTSIKVKETKKAIACGADEIDMVASISAIKRGDYRYVRRETLKIVKAAKGRTVKVIIETGLLTDKEITKAATAVMQAKASFVKTSTGYFGGGATVQAVKRIREAVGDKCSIKASGGIRTAEDFIAMLSAGADRIGTSAGVTIAEQLSQKYTP